MTDKDKDRDSEAVQSRDKNALIHLLNYGWQAHLVLHFMDSHINVKPLRPYIKKE